MFQLMRDHALEPPRETLFQGGIPSIADLWIQEEECGFSPGHGTLDWLYCLYRVLEDFQHVLGWFAGDCEAAGMRNSISQFEAMVLDSKKVDFPQRWQHRWPK